MRAGGSYAARGAARAAASALASRARMVRLACSRTRAIRRTRSGVSPHSCLSRPNCRSTEARPRYSAFHRSVLRGTRVCSRPALTQRLAGRHSAVGQRHFDAPRLTSDPANVHVPCSQDGAGPCRRRRRGAPGQRSLVLPQLDREPVGRVHGRHRAQRIAERGVVADGVDQRSSGGRPVRPSAGMCPRSATTTFAGPS